MFCCTLRLVGLPLCVSLLFGLLLLNLGWCISWLLDDLMFAFARFGVHGFVCCWWILLYYSIVCFANWLVFIYYLDCLVLF